MEFLPIGFLDLVESGEAQVVLLTADQGSRAYGSIGRLFLPAGAETYSNLRYACVPCGTNAGTIALRMAPLWASDDATTRNIIAARTTTATTLNLLWLTPGKFRASIFDGTTTKVCELTPAAFAAGSIISLVARFDASNLWLSMAGEADPAAAAHTLTLPASAALHVGHSGGAASANSYIGPVITSQECWSAAWKDSILANGGAAFSDVVGLASNYLRKTPDMLLPLASDSIAYMKVA